MRRIIQIIAYLLSTSLILYFIIDAQPPIVFTLLLLFFLVMFIAVTIPKTKKNKQLPAMTKVKEEHYEKQGMTETEIVFFRDTMNTTKKQIIQLQENMNASTKLKAIDLRNDTLKAAKAFFKELVKEPKKLHLANHFLYTHLPNLVDLSSKYLEIDSHEIKNKQLYEKIEESAQVIDQVAQLIKKDYEAFVSDDLDALDIEISIAKNSLKRDNEHVEEQ